jgi:hypothetical protein
MALKILQNFLLALSTILLSSMKFLEDFNHPKNIRFKSFEKALTIADQRDLKTIVETGVARGKIKFFFIKKFNWKDGMSTLLFSEYAKYKNGHLHACDIEKKNVDNAKYFSKKNKNFCSFYVDDSINFLKKFQNEINFLYLDSLDGQMPGANEHQLAEFKAAEKNLSENCLILLDDKGSKTKLSSNYMQKNGLKIINETDNQLLFSY